jgi:lipopolysaccharide biosynthesis glycosyltransferase
MKVFVGYDPREDIAYQVCKHSIVSKQPNATVVPLIQQELRDAGWYHRPVDKLASTEFTFTRFLIPELANFDGWALFMDCDMILTTDIKQLFDQADDQYAVMCVKHDYTPKGEIKMDGKKQTIYPRKNWSSVMLFNCSHPSNKKLTKDLVNNENIKGAYLHRFSWLDDHEIGELGKEWNWLVNWYSEPDDGIPKLIHYTEGGPWFENYRTCQYHREWKAELFDMMS